MNYAKIMLAGLIRRIATSYSQGLRANRHVTTDHMQKFEDLKNATGLGSKGAFIKIRNMGILEHNKEGSNERSLLQSGGLTQRLFTAKGAMVAMPAVIYIATKRIT